MIPEISQVNKLPVQLNNEAKINLIFDIQYVFIVICFNYIDECIGIPTAFSCP